MTALSYLATDHGIYVAASGQLGGYLVFAPRGAAVVAAVDLSVVGAAVNVGRNCRVNGDLEHAARWCVAQVHSFPGLAHVVAAE